MQELTRDLAVYVLARTDLPSLNSGKGMSQAHHAGVQMVSKHGDQALVQQYIQDGVSQGADQFNTTIVLGTSLITIELLLKEAAAVNRATGDPVVVFDSVTDPSYPFFVENKEIVSLIPQTDSVKVINTMADGRVLMVRPEVTCAWFLGCRANPSFRALFEGLDLHP